MLALYTDLWLVDRQPLYARVVADTAAWAMREMQAPDGGYYSTLDADSEHEEGKFYVWTPEEVRGVLTEQEYAVVAPHFGLDAPPNFEHKYWHLQVVKPLAAIVAGLGITMQEAQARLDEARVKLLALRGRRVRPARDEKILTSWNALMIKGMTHASRVFDQPQWLASARSAAEFIRASLWIPDAERGNGGGRLLATYKDGKAHLNAYLDDYAFLLDALLELMQAEFSAIDLEWARSLAEVMLDRFEDREHGGFFFVSDDHEQLLHRAKIGPRSDTPSGNSVAAVALERLGHILGEPRYTEAARARRGIGSVARNAAKRTWDSLRCIGGTAHTACRNGTDWTSGHSAGMAATAQFTVSSRGDHALHSARYAGAAADNLLNRQVSRRRRGCARA